GCGDFAWNAWRSWRACSNTASRVAASSALAASRCCAGASDIFLFHLHQGEHTVGGLGDGAKVGEARLYSRGGGFERGTFVFDARERGPQLLGRRFIAIDDECRAKAGR